MSDSITCPHCKRLLQVPENHEGRQLRCPECQGVFVSGPQTDITAKAPQPPGEWEITEDAPRRPGSARRSAEDDDDDRLDEIALRRDFTPGGLLALSVKLLFGCVLLLHIVMLGSDYLQYELAVRMNARINVPDAEIRSNDARQLIIGIIQFATFIPTVICFVCWFHRCHANLEALGARNLKYTSGWAAGCWFVPILNLYRPVQIAQEIWRNSDPTVVAHGDVGAESPTDSALIGFWWAMWIISNISANVALRMDVTSPQSLQTATAVGMVAEALSAVAALLALAVIVRIDARQTARAEAMRLDY